MTRQGLTVPLLAAGVLYSSPLKTMFKHAGVIFKSLNEQISMCQSIVIMNIFRKQSPCMKTFQYKFISITIVPV